jgi:hypothetical protein
MALDYQSLVNAVRDYGASGDVSGAMLLKLALLKNIAATVAPAVNTDYQTLLSNSNVLGYNAASNSDVAALIEMALLQIIALNVGGGGGGSGSVLVANYGGVAPGVSPASAAIAIDTSNGAGWSWDTSTWARLF